MNSGLTPFFNSNEMIEFLVKNVADSKHLIFNWIKFKILTYNEELWNEIDFQIKRLWKDWHIPIFKAEIDQFYEKPLKSLNNPKGLNKDYKARKYLKQNKKESKHNEKEASLSFKDIIYIDDNICKLNHENIENYVFDISQDELLEVEYNLYVDELLPTKYDKNIQFDQISNQNYSVNSLNQL